MKNKNIECFVGKICSVFTTPLNRDFALEGPSYLQQLLHYFLGTIESVDDEGILLSQQNGLKIYVFKSHLIAIAEEETLNPDNPEDAKVIKNLKPLPTRRPPSPLPPKDEEMPVPKKEVTEVKIPDFLDIESITTLANNLQKNFGKSV